MLYYFIEEGQPASGHRGIRTHTHTYVITLDNDDEERKFLYNNSKDPYQLKNSIGADLEIEKSLHNELLQELTIKKDPWLERYQQLVSADQ